ncbi:MAG: hypothetical protein KatS3mg045_1178 [Bellilinea sp.]|nr:MAG: hypothetical protein KatS3mg045_1178 [Bellilinea sp.]
MAERMRRVWLVVLVSVLAAGLIGRPQGRVAAGIWPAFNAHSRNIVGETEIPPQFQQVGENETFILYANPSTLAFKVLDKRSGYLWHSNLDAPAPGDRLNRSWTAFADSAISIEYLDEKAVNKRISISNGGTVEDFRPNGRGFEAAVLFADFGIGMRLSVGLESDGVHVEIPFASIRQENPAYKLGLVYLYPFMGATRADEVSGYILIPDGSGSLIPLAATTKARTMFYGRYYGADLGMIAQLPFDPNLNRPYRLSLPVMGMVHGEGQNAFLSIVEDGSAYAELHVHPAGIITNFNFAYHAFIYNQSYFQATNRAGAGVTTLQKETNAFDIRVRYRFLTGDESDYVGMARSYRQFLVEKGWLKPVPQTHDQIGIHLEFLGGDKEKVLLWNRMIPMTTVEQMRAILDDLQIGRVEAVYYGWQPLGASSMLPDSLRLDRQLGSLSDLHILSEDLAANGGRLYLYADPQAALRDEGGYSPRRDLAMAITGVYMIGYNRYKVSYYLNADSLGDRLSRLAVQTNEKLAAGLALDQIGTMLYSDFRTTPALNREQTLRRYQQLLDELSTPLAFYNPNAYVFGVMQAYFDMPLDDSGYIFTAESVPFLPIVLAGIVPFYGPPLNFSSDPQGDRLRHADYGVYPSFFLSHEVTAKILNTSSSWVFTSAYAQWGDEVKETYRWLNNLLAPALGQPINTRQKLAEGVFATTYANGYRVIVNYSTQPFVMEGGLIVPARDARGIAGGQP